MKTIYFCGDCKYCNQPTVFDKIKQAIFQIILNRKYIKIKATCEYYFCRATIIYFDEVACSHFKKLND
jgi:hypothetical protein